MMVSHTLIKKSIERSYFPNFCKCVFNSDPRSFLSQIQTFIHNNLNHFDRFIFIYPKTSPYIIKPYFSGKLIQGLVIAEKSVFFSLLYPDIRGYTNNIDSHIGLFNFFEHQERFITLWALTYDEVSEIMGKFDPDNPSTCIIFINLDQQCYQAATLFNFHTSILPYLSQQCGYLFITENYNSPCFYQWLASKVNMPLETQNFININDQIGSFDKWEFLTFSDVSLEFKEINFSDSIWKEINKMWQELPELQTLVSDVHLVEKMASIQFLNNKKSGRTAWFKLRQFILALLIYSKISLKERLLIVTNSFEEEIWNNFRVDYTCPKYEEKLSPSFIAIDKIYSLNDSTLKNYDRILLDLGDELTPWLSQPFLTHFIEKASFLQQILRSKSVTFYHPFLLSEELIKRLLTTPPISHHIIRISDVQKQQYELLYTTMLFVALKRQNKAFFYKKVSSYWTQKLIDKKFSHSLPEQIKLLRLSGLMDQKHFKTTALGKFFLQNRLLITDFIDHIKSDVPSQFEWKLTEKPSKVLFHSYYISCAKWLFHTTKYDYFSAQYLRIFLQTINYSFHRDIVDTSFQDDIIETTTELIRQEIDIYPHLKSFFRNRTSKFEDLTLKISHPLSSSKRYWGKALKQALTDIGIWFRSLEASQQMIPIRSFFSVRENARLAVRENKNINESSYVRAVQRVMGAPLSNQTLGKFSDNEERTAIKNLSNFFRDNLVLKYVKLKNNKSSLVITLKSIELLCKKNLKILNFEYLSYSCRYCIYFEQRRKNDCILFNRVYFIDKDRIPQACRGREHSIFSNLLGCPLWRPKYQILITKSKEQVFRCVHCNKLLPIMPAQPPDEIICSCETLYRIFLEKDDSVIYEYQLTPKHTIYHELQLLFPEVTFKARTRRIHDIRIPSANQYEYMKHDLPSLREVKENYLFIRQSDTLDYDKNEHKLGVFEINGYGEYYNLQEIQLIDSQKNDLQFFSILRDYPVLGINIRSSSISLSQKDQAKITYNENSQPILQVKKNRRKKPEYYPFNDLISIYNIGKSRLKQPLQKWGVEQIYYSSKGIRSEPLEKLEEAITLKGVRPVLSDIHLLGLVLSAINATTNLISVMYKIGYDQLGDQLFTRMKELIFRSPSRLYQFYYRFNPRSNLNRTALEAWIYRPFAEGMRELVLMTQDQDYPMITSPYGRTVARLVWKRGKSGFEFLGGYTPFDTALNTLNRTLRYQLRIWNAKTGFGFKTFPLFSHQPSDKRGRAGHLDLEEPGRIISRFVLVENIIGGQLKGNQFDPQFDDDQLIYYTPSAWIQRRLLHHLVKKQIFPFQVYYNHQWISYSEAHKQHIYHLRWCLENCLDMKTISSRKKFLFNNYQPLLFSIKTSNRDTKEIWSELMFLFNHCWQKWTNKLFLRKKINSKGVCLLSIDQTLIERIIVPILL